VSFQPSAPHKQSRWLALIAIVMLASTLLVSAAVAAPSFTFQGDDQGANDEPGQKDLTAQSSAVDASAPNHFFTAWKWDDTAWSGNNTGDGCSLFDTDAVKNGLVDYAVCGTVTGKNPVTLLAVSLYSCSDKRVDRCTNPVLRLTATSTASTYCTVTDKAGGQFDSADTLIVCDITALAAASNPPISDLTGGTLINTCSYPSKEPNSDPSDCVVTPTAANTSVSTQSGGTWSVTLSDSAQLTPNSATGSVVFNLWSDSLCTVSQWVSASVGLNASGAASTSGAGTTSGTNVITNVNVNSDGKYYWTVDYTPSGLFNASSSACGELNTISIPVVTGAPG
jgi:hypothetical protein